MRNRINLSVLFLFGAYGLSGFSQVTKDRDVVGSAGEVSTVSSLEVSWTMGEVAISYNTPGIIVSEGFQQGDLIDNPSGIKEDDFAGKISIYPNPVRDILYFNIESSEDLELTGSIKDITGREVVNIPLFTIINSYSGKVDMETLPAGTWFLNIQSPSGKFIRTYKVVKIN